MVCLVLGIVLALVGIGLILHGKSIKMPTDKDSYRVDSSRRYKTVCKYAGSSVAVIAGFFFLFSVVTMIPAGHVGVPTLFGKVVETTLPEGISLVNPLWDIHRMSIRTETYTMVSAAVEGAKTGDDSIYVQSSDGVVMNMDVTIAYRLLSKDAPIVFRYFGLTYAESIVRSASKSALPEITSKYSFQEAYTYKRDELGYKVGEKMNKVIKSLISQQAGSDIDGIVVQQVLVRKIEPPVKIKASIELKMAAEQESERMKYVLLKEKQEAERKKIEAEGIQKFQDIVSKGISEQLLKWKGIEATEALAKSTNAKVVIIGAGKEGMPIILGGQ